MAKLLEISIGYFFLGVDVNVEIEDGFFFLIGVLGGTSLEPVPILVGSTVFSEAFSLSTGFGV
jgi:hypothetical protein